MSALDDAYEAAADALRRSATEDFTVGALSRATVDAFLAHLADNPPEEFVRALDTTEGYGPVEHAGRLFELLRSIQGVKA